MSNTVTIHNYPDNEPNALAAALTHTERFDRWDAKVFVQKRLPSGWLEYGLSYFNPNNAEHQLYVALVQRTPDAEFEFHS
ncbi:hypothetical protein [Methylotenera sp.]|uniref:hypothetical protein n=1 Tax=Methylotenera sp. TaxID=2051956 RepID=UPI0024881D47|nr:hypothetical protein [Methylotenera sp.]MDI1362570.1 hypothetical protein [Methylotenera sp.]